MRFLSSLTSIPYFALMACSGTALGAVEGSLSHGFRHVRHRHSAAALPGLNGTRLERRFDNGKFSYWYVSQDAVACSSNMYKDSEFVVALNIPQWDGASHCGEKVTISWGGKSTSAIIVDQCVSCPSGGLDLSPGLFTFFAGSLDPGLIWGNWYFGDEQPGSKASPTSSSAEPTYSSSSSSSSSHPHSSTESPTSSHVASATPSPTNTHNSTSSSEPPVDPTSLAQPAVVPSATTQAGTIDQWMQAYMQVVDLIAAAKNTA